MQYKKGDVIKVWSLQSFFQGGFLNGVEGIVTQDQGIGNSVLITVPRKIDGKVKLDYSYEVYPEQLKFIHRAKKKDIINEFTALVAKLKGA